MMGKALPTTHMPTNHTRLFWQFRRALCLSIFMLGLWLLGTPTALAQTEAPEAPLTLDLLKTRIKTPLPSEGAPLIDLRHLNIDLGPSSPLETAFYSLLSPVLQAQPIGLDLSDSRITGDLKIDRLATPLTTPLTDANLTAQEQTQLQLDRRRLLQLNTLTQSLLLRPIGPTNPSTIHLFRGPLLLNRTTITGNSTFNNTFFLDRLQAQSAQFQGSTDWSQTRFGKSASFSNARFSQEARFRNSLFFDRANFNQAQFQSTSNFQGSEFQAAANFNQVQFTQGANLSRTTWQGTADFAQTQWQGPALLSKSRFAQALFFTDALFTQALNLRESQFQKPVNLRGAAILDRADFGYCNFSQEAYLNVPGLQFDADRAKFVGDAGRIGQMIRLPNLQGNENLLRELVRNFRRLEQIGDANQVDYTRQRLRTEDLRRRTWGLNLNSATIAQLQAIGFSPTQATAIDKRRQTQPLTSLTELLTLGEVDLATYTELRDRVVAGDRLPLFQDWTQRLGLGSQWLATSLILLLSRNGTSFWLAFGVGLVAAPTFAVMFWWIDRARRFQPVAIVPGWGEFTAVASMALTLAIIGFTAIARNGDRPALTLICLAFVILPIPLGLMGLLYRQGRFHPELGSSYFVEEGTLRQLRILVGRLPVIPRFQLFKDRYIPLPWDKAWNWLNYFDFSFNNFLRLGFNDIRLRDQHVPTLLNMLVWYQWSLGTLYIALLLWTLSRTIPGLNLLIYFR
jgi:hypothetical protein